MVSHTPGCYLNYLKDRSHKGKNYIKHNWLPITAVRLVLVSLWLDKGTELQPFCQ